MNVPKRLRQDPAKRKELFDLLQPQPLRSVMRDLAHSAPDGISDYVSAICAYTPPGSTRVDAFAEAPGKNVRIITVTQGFMWILMTTVVLFEELEAPVRETSAEYVREKGKQIILEPHDALMEIDRLADNVHAELSFGHRAEDLVTILLDSRNRPDQLSDAFAAIIGGPPPSPITHGLIGSALRFVLAHEASHMLLNHTPRKSSGSVPPSELSYESNLIESRWSRCRRP